ncbi:MULTISPECIES: hypothetical protein [Bacillus]|uniref:hypothetical protein n=1 Tax=Bacillus TaxID=1386 RepID=UPI0013923306|nr:hypothetical protein [Bacillus pseudomycoides]MED1597164.1 hypothetical protein [Bacillus pseudomycoides]MED4653733.1 hypothetical protein [Bacillus pseudomycoides]MED4712708.1 hypothetical protein [Bacillus pseudomycoides]
MYRVEDDVEEEKLIHFHKKPNFTCPMGANIQIILAHTQEAMDQVLENMAMEQLVTSLVNKNKFFV